jgi:hypothetical protein
VLDATQGPISVDAGAVIQSFTRLEGPCHVGIGARLFRANIQKGTTIGPFCRVGGEVEASILHGYVNKYHEGFLGHSYLCPWVNLGALSTSSDLKNDNNSNYKLKEAWDGADQWFVVRDVGAALGETGKMYPRRNWLDGFERHGFITGIQGDTVEFDYQGRRITGIEQNPRTRSRWAELARQGERVMQFTTGTIYRKRVRRQPVALSGLARATAF